MHSEKEKLRPQTLMVGHFLSARKNKVVASRAPSELAVKKINLYNLQKPHENISKVSC